MSPALPTRTIGKDQVTAISYGAMSIGTDFYGKQEASDEERFKCLDKLYELGCTSWDTARMYGDSEELIGKWFAKTGNRKNIFLATKFGIDVKKRAADSSAEAVEESLATSLKLLQTDHIDLYYQHRPDPKVPIELVIRQIKGFIDQGKVRYIGLSEASPDTIRRAHKVHPISAIQVEYSPWELDLEKPGGVIATARELGITIIAYSPTGRGLITGRYKSIDDLPENDFRRTVPKYKAENWPRINKLIEEFQKVADVHHATTAQIALAWLLTQGDDIVPIPGSRQIKYIEENVKAAYIKLSPEEVKHIRQLCDEVCADLGSDTRYADMSTIYADTPPLKE